MTLSMRLQKQIFCRALCTVEQLQFLSLVFTLFLILFLDIIVKI